MMSNLGATLVKLMMLAVGGLAGAVLARVLDDTLTKQAEERSERDKRRYEQGLAPIQSGQKEERSINA